MEGPYPAGALVTGRAGAKCAIGYGSRIEIESGCEIAR